MSINNDIFWIIYVLPKNVVLLLIGRKAMKVAFFGRKAMKENFTYIKWKKIERFDKRQRKGFDVLYVIVLLGRKKCQFSGGKIRPTSVKV